MLCEGDGGTCEAPAKLEGLPKKMTHPWDAPNPDYLQVAQLSGIAAAVTEAVFAVLLAALAVELVLRGLADLGVIQSVGH